MARSKERKEKICLNCDTTVKGRYCQACGQENIEPHQSFWHLATHFVYDTFHFDGKFFSTLKCVLFRPGFLTGEFLRGKRMAYLHPVKMYVFSSAVFFLIYFSFFTEKEQTDSKHYVTLAVETMKQDLTDSIANTPDSIRKKEMLQVKEYLGKIYFSKVAGTKDGSFNEFDNNSEDANSSTPSTIEAYDSIQHSLPSNKRDGFLDRYFSKKNIRQNHGGAYANMEYQQAFENKLVHSIPQMIFLSLPLLAMLLKLLYIKRKHPWYYVDHVIFLIHIYIALYMALLIYYCFEAIKKTTGWAFFGWLSIAVGFYIGLYILSAMYKFYRQGFFKTLLKFLLFLLTGSIVVLFLMAIFAIITFAIV